MSRIAAHRHPEPGEILEEDYQQLLGLLAEEKMRIWNTAVSEKRDLMEYYTMWVHQIKTPIAALKLLIEEDIPGEEEPFGADRERLQQQREKRRDEELQQLLIILLQDFAGFRKILQRYRY